MDADLFITLAERLTGTPVKDISPTDRGILGQLLAEDDRPIGHSQLNELLLLVNKDRMERAFFEYFFHEKCTVAALERGVQNFQKVAMLGFGNFIYAYRTLSRSPSIPVLEAALGEWARQPSEIQNGLASRSPKLVDIDPIPREETPLVGYISAAEVVAEDARGAFLRDRLPGTDDLHGADWLAYEESLNSAADPSERDALARRLRITASETPVPRSPNSPPTSTRSSPVSRRRRLDSMPYARWRGGTRTST